ncbi:MAG: sugar transferase, partial [Flavobacteriales bacterium]|nr:sugar transferase [Flavobacteriales bacterium]
MNQRAQVTRYVLADFASAGIAWTLLYIFRKKILEPQKFGYEVDLDFGSNFFLGLIFIPIFWIMLYTAAGHYLRIYRRYRLLEFGQVLWASVVGVLFIFFVFILDDHILSYRNYYQSLLVLFTSHFLLTLLFRLALTSRTVSMVHAGKIGFNTLIVGGNERALNMFEEIRSMRENPGYKFTGFVRVNGKDNLLSKHIPYLGTYEVLPGLIR